MCGMSKSIIPDLTALSKSPIKITQKCCDLEQQKENLSDQFKTNMQMLCPVSKA